MSEADVPTLRFSEFEGAWEEKRLGDLVSLQSGFAFSSDYFGDAGRKLMTPKNFTTFGMPSFTSENTKWTLEETSPKFLCGPDSLLMLLTDLTPSCELLGKTVFLSKDDGEVWLNQRIVKIQTDPEKLNSKFIHGFFQTDGFHKRIVETASGSTVRHSSNGIVGDTQPLIPTLTEQQKIADFFGAVDARVGLLRRRRDALRAYKKGLMQRLFTQELRFTKPDGSPFPDWQQKRLGEVVTIGSGRDYKHLSHGEIPVYGTGGYMTSVNDYLYDGDSVCIGRKGTIDAPAFLTGKFWTVDTLFYTHKFKGVLPRFLFAIFQRINWLKHNEASGVPSLSKSTIESMEIKLPHPEEQQKIADTLTALDAKIDAIIAQMDAMLRFKKGLLQQMFV